MLLNYIKVALRNLKHQPLLGLLIVVGLTIGLTVYWLLAAYIWHELSYDKNTPNLYRLTQSAPNNDPWLLDHPVVSRSIAVAVPGIERVTRIKPVSGLVKSSLTTDNESQLFFADPTIFDSFGVSIAEGNLESFSDPGTVVLTKSVALKYFGKHPALGQLIQVFGNDGTSTFSLRVIGILADWPATSHFQPDFLIPYREGVSSQDNMGVYSYFELNPMSSPDMVEKQINELKKIHARAWKTEPSVAFHLQPVNTIHLHSNFNDEIGTNGNIKSLYILSMMALLVVLLACINYINITLAQSTVRIREIGMRKALGSGRRQILYQFLIESGIRLVGAVVFAAVLVKVSLPNIMQFLGKDVHITLQMYLWLSLPLLLVIWLGVSIYPALILANFQLNDALKSSSPLRFMNRNRLREGLTILQFSLSVALLVSALVMYRQLSFIQNKALGFNKEQVITIRVRNAEAQSHLTVLKNRIRQIPEVEAVGASHATPGDEFSSVICEMPAVSNKNGHGDGSFSATSLVMDLDYFRLMELRLLAGRSFNALTEQADSRHSLLINETAVKDYGWREPKRAIGQKIGVWNNSRRQFEFLTVIGVVGDFHFQSLHEKVEPVLLMLASDSISMVGYAGTLGVLSVEITPNKMAETITSIEKIWRDINPEQPFEFSFIDQRFDQLYQKDVKEGQLCLLFACITTLITCFGLYSMASLNVAKRRKEIGIRKVLGSSVINVLLLINKDFLKLVLLSIIVGTVFALPAVHKWLQNFAYRVEIEWWIIIIAGLIVIVGALLTVSIQSLKTALMNPVKSLHSE